MANDKRSPVEEANSFVFNTSESPCRQNFPKEIEDALNEQVTKELSASNTYLAISAFLGRDGINLYGFRKFFKDESESERGHAKSFMDYILLRGGEVKLGQILGVENNWKSVVDVVERALNIEKEVNASLLRLSQLCSDKKDIQTSDFLTKFTAEQAVALREFSDVLTDLRRISSDGKSAVRYDVVKDDRLGMDQVSAQKNRVGVLEL
jgi:ferritin heavy chain